MIRKILLTGRPGMGKTTVLVRTSEMYAGNAGGFYTTEIREGGRRVGFEIVTLCGEKAVLAHVHSDSRYRVGKYGVEIENLALALAELRKALACENCCLFIDEIGRMELFSAAFLEVVLACFQAPNPLVATIMARPHPFCDALKQRPDIRLITVTHENRDHLPRELYKIIMNQ